MPNVKNGLSRVSTFAAFFNDKISQQMSSKYHKSKLKSPSLELEVFDSYSNCSDRCKIRCCCGQVGFILCSWWDREKRLVHYL